MNDEAEPPALPTQPQREESTVGAEEMQGPPQRTPTPTQMGEPGGGTDRPRMQSADTLHEAAHRSDEALAAGRPGAEPKGPTPDTECEDRLRRPSAADRASAPPLANLALRGDASMPGGAPQRDPPETRSGSETREATPDTPRRTAEGGTSPDAHNPDDDSLDAFMDSCRDDPHAVPAPAVPSAHPEPQCDQAEDAPLTASRQAHLQRDRAALEQVTTEGEGQATASGAADRTADERSAPGEGARVEAATNTASEPIGPPPGTAPPWGRGHLDYARLEGNASHPSEQAEHAATQDLGLWIPRLIAGEQLVLAVSIRWVLSSRSRHLGEGTRTMADVTFGHRTGHTPPATMDHPGQWHYVATRLMAHMGAYSPDEMNGLHWQWHQRAALRIRTAMHDHGIWESLDHRATKDTPQANGGRGPRTSRSLPGRRHAKTPRNARRVHHPGGVPPLAPTEAPCHRSPRGGARAVPTPRGCKAARQNSATRQGILADPVAAAARRLPRRGESSSMTVWTGTTRAPATPTPGDHHLPPTPGAGPRGPAPNRRTSPPSSRQSSANDRQRFTRTPTRRRKKHPARPPPTSQGQRPTHCREEHTPRTGDQGSLRPTQALRKEQGGNLPRSPEAAKPRKTHRGNRGTTRAAQGRTQK